MIDYPYWLVFIRNNSSTQWANHLGVNCDAFCFSDRLFDVNSTAAQSLYGYGVKFGIAFYNLDLKITEFSRSMSDDFFDNGVENIPQLEFSLSRPWNDLYGNYSTKDWMELIRLAIGNKYTDAFTFDGATVELWLCNGVVTGYTNQAGTNTWDLIGSSTDSATYVPPSTYSIIDQAYLKFTGRVTSKKNTRTEMVFSCESSFACTDSLISSTPSDSKNSTSTIVPIPFGVMDPPTFIDDYAAGFPLVNGKKVGNSSELILSDCDIASFYYLLWRDSKTKRPVIVDSGVQAFTRRATLSESIVGITMEKNRLSSGIFDLSLNEKNYVVPFVSLEYDRITQTISEDSGEKIGFHSRSINGACGFPTVGSSIVYDNTARLESRGWGETTQAAHSIGSNFSIQTDEGSGSFVTAHIDLPVSDVCESDTTLSNDTLLSGDHQVFRGSAGNIKELIKNTDYGVVTSGDGFIKLSNRNYGPATYNGSPTGFYTDPLQNYWCFVIRTEDIDFSDQDDTIQSIKLFITAKLEVLGEPLIIGGAEIDVIRNPNYSMNPTATENVQCGSRIYVNNLKTSESGTYEFDVLLNIDDNTLSTFRDENRLMLKCRISSGFLDSPLRISHPVINIYKLKMRYTFRTRISDRPLLWYGAGLKQWGTSSVANSAEVALYSFLKTYSSIDVSLNTVTNAIDSPISGAVTEAMTVRDIARSICSNHSLILRNVGTGIEVYDYLRKASGYVKTVVDGDIDLDSDGWISLEESEVESEKIYSGIIIKFRQYLDGGEYSASIGVGYDFVKEYNVDNNKPVGTYTASAWTTIGQTLLSNLTAACVQAQNKLASQSGQARIKTYEMGFVRNRGVAEKMLARLVVANTQRRNIIDLTGNLSSWHEVNIGDQVEFDLSEDYMNIHMQYSAGLRRFMVVGLRTFGTAKNPKVSVRLSEIPYIPQIGTP